jgi:hypothetical protein
MKHEVYVCLFKIGVMALGSTVFCACAPSEEVARERLDESSGVTYSAARQALVYARTDARYSRSTRDYLYVGPMESNRQGLREYYLWVGIATTLDRGYLAPVAVEPQVLYMVVDGELMEFPLSAWQVSDSHGTTGAIYDTPVEIGASFAARVTRNQLDIIAASRPESLTLKTRDGATRVFYRWADGRDWAASDSAAIAPDGNVVLR